MKPTPKPKSRPRQSSRPTLAEIVARNQKVAATNLQAVAAGTKERLCAVLGGEQGLSRMKAVYKSARAKRGRWGPCILTADEVFRSKAREDGFSDEAIALFIEQSDL